MKTFKIIDNAKKWLSISIILVVSGIGIFLTNMNLSIQFTGGLEFILTKVGKEASLQSSLTEFVKSKGYKDFKVSVGKKDGNVDILFQINVGNDEKVEEFSNSVKEYLINNGFIISENDIVETSIIGPSIGEYMKNSALSAILFGIVFMTIYILFAFSGLRSIISPLYLAGVIIFTMIFDIAIPSGAYGLMMYLNPTVQIDSIFIIAILTVMGYSINDTIIIFDRIRENLQLNEGKILDGKVNYNEVFENSLWQSMRRSIGTSFSTLLVVIAMFIFGSGILKIFSFTMGIGIIAGTVSSIFISAPFAYLILQKGLIKNQKTN